MFHGPRLNENSTERGQVRERKKVLAFSSAFLDRTQDVGRQGSGMRYILVGRMIASNFPRGYDTSKRASGTTVGEG